MDVPGLDEIAVDIPGDLVGGLRCRGWRLGESRIGGGPAAEGLGGEVVSDGLHLLGVVTADLDSGFPGDGDKDGRPAPEAPTAH